MSTRPTFIERTESHFRFTEHQTTWRIELLAGLTTFITMAYIVFVNPAILSQTGMPLAAVTTSTCLCAAFGSILMGALANYPLALAPGMDLNAYFTYTVVKGMHVPWQTALGAVFLSGIIFLLLTFGGIRQRLVGAIPDFATAPALILVGALMLGGISSVDWNAPRIAIPCFLTLITIPLTYSIATGLSFGLISFAILEIATGRARRQHWMLYLLALIFLCRFIYLRAA
jgi:AGZA family xanthine/uracil permease-like MFS transporter